MEGNKDSENKTLLLPRHFSTRFTETGEQDRNKARTAQYKKKQKKNWSGQNQNKRIENIREEKCIFSFLLVYKDLFPFPLQRKQDFSHRNWTPHVQLPPPPPSSQL